MRKFFDINIPFNRLQFNICFFVLGALFIFLSVCYFNNFSIFEEYPVDYPIFVQWLILIGFLIDFCLFFGVFYKRLIDIKTKRFIFGYLFLSNLFLLCGWILFVISISTFNDTILNNGLPVFVCLSCLVFLYLLFLAIFVKGKSDDLEEYMYQKINVKNIFNNKFFKNWTDFNGRASRSEFFLYGISAMFIFVFLKLGFDFSNQYSYYGSVFTKVLALVLLILTLSVVIRRLRDIGLSLWHYLILYVFPVNVLLLIVLMFGESEKPTENEKASQ